MVEEISPLSAIVGFSKLKLGLFFFFFPGAAVFFVFFSRCFLKFPGFFLLIYLVSTMEEVPNDVTQLTGLSWLLYKFYPLFVALLYKPSVFSED